MGWLVYAGVYSVGLKRRKKFPIPIVGVGNLEVGGLGKTPVSIEIARMLSSAGLQVAVSASGYGSPASEAATLAPAGELEPSRWGDEPALIRAKLPDVPLIVGRRRTLAAEIAFREGFDALVLDDGFQHLPLGRTVDFLIYDPLAVNRRCIPSGPMREPTIGARRATAVLIGSEHGESVFGLPDFRFRRRFTGLVSHSGEKLPLDWLSGRSVHAVCAIARPIGFFDALAELGANLVSKTSFKDHDALNRELPSGAPIVVTEKDAVKLRRGSMPFYALEMDVEFDDKEAVESWLLEKLRA